MRRDRRWRQRQSPADVGDVADNLDAAVVLQAHVNLWVRRLEGRLQLAEGDDEAAGGEDHQRSTAGRRGRAAYEQRGQHHDEDQQAAGKRSHGNLPS